MPCRRPNAAPVQRRDQHAGPQARARDRRRASPVNAPATMMPSMPRLSTPARSHSSTPSVPKISGVAMRSTADPEVGVAEHASTSRRRSIQARSPPAQPIRRGERGRDQHRQQRDRHDHVGDVGRHRDTARLMLSAPTSTPATKIAAATTPSGLSPASIAMTMPRVAVAGRHVERDVAGAPGDLDRAGEPRERARQRARPASSCA